MQALLEGCHVLPDLGDGGVVFGQQAWHIVVRDALRRDRLVGHGSNATGSVAAATSGQTANYTTEKNTLTAIQPFFLHDGRIKAQVSYLTYPEFDRRAHPVLRGSLVVQLRHRQVRYLDFTQSANPPVLHRKDLFVDATYPRRSLFQRLTHAEERLGLLDDPA